MGRFINLNPPCTKRNKSQLYLEIKLSHSYQNDNFDLFELVLKSNTISQDRDLMFHYFKMAAEDGKIIIISKLLAVIDYNDEAMFLEVITVCVERKHVFNIKQILMRSQRNLQLLLK